MNRPTISQVKTAVENRNKWQAALSLAPHLPPARVRQIEANFKKTDCELRRYLAA